MNETIGYQNTGQKIMKSSKEHNHSVSLSHEHKYDTEEEGEHKHIVNDDDINQGYYFAGAQSNVTTSFIYVLAFVHILHLIAGLIVLSVLIYKTYNNKYKDSNLGFSLGVTFWHFLDLLWLYLFLFFYFFG